MVLWLLILLPALAGGILLVFGRKADGAAAPVSVLVAVVLLGLAVAAALLRPAVQVPGLEGIPAGLAVDGLAAAAVVTVAGIFLAVIVFAGPDLASSEARARFFGLMLLFVAAMLMTVTSTGMLTLLGSWELMGAISYALIGYWWPDAARVRSATLAFITTRAADLGMYLAAGAALAGGAAGLRLDALALMPGGWRDAALAGLALAALGKSAQLPFSFWLSHAMAGPSPVSALLHSATMVAAGGYLLLRIQPGMAATGWLGPAVAWVGALTALLLGAVAFAQRDLKQLLAASTCSQIGFIVLAAGAGSVAGGAAQFVAHAAVKSLLFLIAGAWLTALGTRDLLELRGVARGSANGSVLGYRTAGVTFTAGALALGGLPPLSVWAAKDEILAGVLRESPALYIVGLAAAAVSAAYAAKALAVVWAKPAPSVSGRANPAASVSDAGPAAAAGKRQQHRLPTTALLPLPVLATAAVVFGVAGVPAVSRWWQDLLGLPETATPAPWELAVSAILALAVIGGIYGQQTRRLLREGMLVGAPAGNRLTAWLGNWLGLEHAASVLITRPAMSLAVSLARFDDRVLARSIDAAAVLVLKAATGTDRRIEHGIGAAVAGIASTFRQLARSARRPQTGLIHQYYAQAIIALTVLAALFVVLR
ncbi:NADH-quinone oxidoreductase subunit L [Paeniglutamicibacter antarcticus]|uniref:NADH-quinone oxidoreductase subunit L n=1 Tax=Arthrobacter terrae TaxID=2935737 RepID=A0A931CQA3_9MICC|nr:proton-conducting transporter membrane subunit [Arthrobacter terrae]MBG0740420.1 NADH-quinone oxidoreductase subunit L [Arthrobacter terrae]